MVKTNIEEFEDKFKEALVLDRSNKDIKIYVYDGKDDLMNKYIKKNLLRIKMDEPVRGETAEINFLKYVEELNDLMQSFSHDETIVVALFGENEVDIKNFKSLDTRLYHLNEVKLLTKDINEFYEK